VVTRSAAGGHVVRSPTRAGTDPLSGRPAVAAAVPFGEAPSKGWCGSATAAPAIGTPTGELTLNPRPCGVKPVSDVVAESHFAPRAVARKPMGREGGFPAPRKPKAGVEGPAAPTAGAACAPLNQPAVRRWRYSAVMHGPKTR